MYAAAEDHTEVVKALLARGAQVNARNKYGNTPFMHAAIGNRVGAARILIKAGAGPEMKNELGKTAWDIAAERGFKDFREKALKPGMRQ